MWVIIYLIGSVASYLYIKRTVSTHFTIWTQKDRVIAITFSFLSWLMVVVVFIHTLSERTDFDKEASW